MFLLSQEAERMQHEGQNLMELVRDLRRICTTKNYRQVHSQILAAVGEERQIRFDSNPAAYVAAPLVYWSPGSPPDELDVFWGIYAPGPYGGVDGRTERRPVDTGMVVHHPPDMPGTSVVRDLDGQRYPSIDVLPHSMCFMERKDAEAFSQMMTLSGELHLMNKTNFGSVSESKRSLGDRRE